MTNNRTLSTTILIAVFFFNAAAAQSMGCKEGNLVNVGDSKATVLLKCGEPAIKDSFCKPNSDKTPVNQGSSSVCETVDEWTYNFGPGQFVRTLRFESGTLKSIVVGDYGK